MFPNVPKIHKTGIKGADSKGGAVYYIVRSQVYRQLDAGTGVRSLDALLESGLCGASVKREPQLTKLSLCLFACRIGFFLRELFKS